MKKISTFFAFCMGLIASTTNAQSLITHDFEQGLSPWTATNGEVVNYNLCPESGGKAYRAKLFLSASNEITEATLTSPEINSDGTPLSFSFIYRVVEFSNYNATPADEFSITLQYSTDDGASWNDKYVINETNHTPSTDCVGVDVTFDASEVPAGAMKFRLRTDRLAAVENETSFFVYFDNIIIGQSLPVPSCASNTTFTENRLNCGAFGGKITWDDVEYATSYTVNIGTTSGGNDIYSGSVNSSEFNLETTANTTYYATIIPKNGTGAATACEEFSFTTGGLCTCESVPTSKDGDGISKIEFPNVTFNQGDVTYANYTNTPVTVAVGEATPITITYVTGYDYDTNIWVDLNNDYEYTADELLFQGESPATNPAIYETSITLPEGTPAGTYSMRIGTADSGQEDPKPCYMGTYGVTMDFVINAVVNSNCTAMEATGTVVPDCDNQQFSVSVEVTTLNNGENKISDGTNVQTIDATGTYTFGPYENDANVTIKTIHSNESICNTEVGTFTHHCTVVGEVCDNPIIVGTLPYTTTDNTGNYLETTTLTADSSGICDWRYTKGRDVFYKFTPTEDTTIDIKLSNISDNYLGIHLLSGCYGTPGTNCLGFAGNTGSNDREINNIDVTAGETYIIWIAAWTDVITNTHDYTLDIKVSENAGTKTHELTNLEVYPNPATDVIYVSNNNKIDTISVYDINGKRVVNNTKVEENSATIRVNHLAKGTYFVKVTSEGKSTIEQIVIK